MTSERCVIASWRPKRRAAHSRCWTRPRRGWRDSQTLRWRQSGYGIAPKPRPAFQTFWKIAEFVASGSMRRSSHVSVARPSFVTSVRSGCFAPTHALLLLPPTLRPPVMRLLMLPAVTLFICKPHAFANPAIERDGEICYRIGALGSAPSCAGPSNWRSGTCIRCLVPSASLQRSQPLGVDDSILRSYASSITVRLPDLICYLILPVRFFSHPCTCAGPLVVIVLTPSHNLLTPIT